MAENAVLTIRNTRIIYRNFAGKTSQFNKNGFRTFNVLLPTELAKQLEKDEWNIKWLEPREEGDEPQAHVQVKVQYDSRIPPKVITITGNNKTPLTEDTIGVLDYAEIEKVDVALNPWRWQVQNDTGIKPYLKTLYVTLIQDEFEADYQFDD